MRGSELKVVGGIVVIGILAALPFARQPANSPTVQPLAVQPSLSNVPLHVPSGDAQSPAIGLRDHDAPLAAPPSLTVPSAAGRSRLDEGPAPPLMSDQYQPLVDGPPSVLPIETRSLHVTRPGGPPKLESPNVPRTHRVVDGDTLERIAERYWGDASQADALFFANRSVLSTPDPLPLGVELTIPARPEKPKVSIAPPAAQAEELPPPVKQPKAAAGVELDEPLVPIPRN